MKLKFIQLLAAAALLLPAAWARAAITCSVSSPGFTTSYDPAAAAQTIVQTQLTVTCTRNLAGDPTTLSYSVGVSNGLYFSAGSNRAKLTTGANYVGYDLYTDSLCANLWRTTPSAKRLPTAPPGTMTLSGFIPTAVNISYWGCIPAGQTGQPAGTYTDTIPMTLYSGTTNTALATGSVPVSIFMSGTCSISTAPGSIIFNYTSFGPTVNASTTFAATCTNTMPYTMALDATSGTLLGLNYTLALSASSATGTGVAQTYTINGAMAAGQVGTCALGACSASQARTLTISY